MNESIGQPAAEAGVGGAVADKTVGVMLGFVRSEGRSGKVGAQIDRIPGTEAAIAAASSGSGHGSLMAVGLTALGLGMGEIESIAGELLRVFLDKIGADRMGKIIAGTPGLGQFA